MVLHEPLYDSKWIKQQRGNKELKSDYSLFKKKKSPDQNWAKFAILKPEVDSEDYLSFSIESNSKNNSRTQNVKNNKIVSNLNRQ